ncbi:hypothetical protein NDU88_006498, partial [Pleurodeles waltl]
TLLNTSTNHLSKVHYSTRLQTFCSSYITLHLYKPPLQATLLYTSTNHLSKEYNLTPPHLYKPPLQGTELYTSTNHLS